MRDLIKALPVIWRHRASRPGSGCDRSRIVIDPASFRQAQEQNSEILARLEWLPNSTCPLWWLLPENVLGAPRATRLQLRAVQ